MSTEVRPSRPRKWKFAVLSVAALALILVPQGAVAAPSWWTFYNGSTTQNAVKTSQYWASLSGGYAGPPPGQPAASENIYYVYSKSSTGALIAGGSSTFNPVTVIHPATSNARSDCHWNRPWSGGTALLYCRSYRG